MAYNALAESIALIESRQVQRVERLSRRRRFAAMSVDVAEDLAVTSFARRGVGCTWHDTHVLARRQGQWVLLGGSGGTGDGDRELLADRPQMLREWSPAVDAPGLVPACGRSLLVSGSAGGVRESGDSGTGRWPWSGRWVSHTAVRASAAVESLVVAGRMLPVPWHGRVVVVWTGRRGPRVVAHDGSGQQIDNVLLTRSN